MWNTLAVFEHRPKLLPRISSTQRAATLHVLLNCICCNQHVWADQAKRTKSEVISRQHQHSTDTGPTLRPGTLARNCKGCQTKMKNKLWTGCDWAAGREGSTSQQVDKSMTCKKNSKSHKITISGVLSRIPMTQETSSMAEVSFSSLMPQ